MAAPARINAFAGQAGPVPGSAPLLWALSRCGGDCYSRFMWGRKQSGGGKQTDEPAAEPTPLKEAVRQARIEAAERTGVVVDLRDAEAARLEILNEALDPVFAEVAPEVELFDRGISKGDVPRLWIDAIAHIGMGRDKRLYRFVQDTRYGRKVIAESAEISDMVGAVTRYIAGRLVERERALADDSNLSLRYAHIVQAEKRRKAWRRFRTFVLAVLLGVAAFFLSVWLVAKP
jgi:hypothetical protein